MSSGKGDRGGVGEAGGECSVGRSAGGGDGPPLPDILAVALLPESTYFWIVSDSQ